MQVLGTNSTLLIHLSLQPDVVNIILSARILSLKYLKSTTLGCKDIRIRKSEFAAKPQFV